MRRTPATIALMLVTLLIGALAPAVSAKPLGPAPDIATISPTQARHGAIVTLTGRDFGGPKVKVSVGGFPATIQTATGARITIVVPSTVPAGETSVRVANPSGQSDSVPFTIDGRTGIRPVLDASRASTLAVGPEGGVLAAVGADGSSYRLTIPAGALDAPRQITLTPVTSISDLPLSGGLRAAAHFEPSGLLLAVPGSLTITRGGLVGPIVAFSYAGQGADLSFAPSSIDATSVVIPIEHFSGAGIGTPSASDFDAFVAPILASLGQLTRAQVRGLIEVAMDWERQFGANFCETRTSCAAAMQRAHDLLIALANAACLTGHADLGTSRALRAAVAAGRQLTQDEVAWDALRLIDESLGAGTAAPDSIPLSVAGQVSAAECRGAILERVITRATTLAQLNPYATSDVGAAPGEDDVSNIGWLFSLAAAAAELGRDDLVQQVIQAGEAVVERLLLGDPNVPGSGAVAQATTQPLEAAPAVAQAMIVVHGSDVDGDSAMSAWEWLLFLSTEAMRLGLPAGNDATSTLEDSLEAILTRGASTCRTDEVAGQAQLERGRTYARAVALLVEEFDAALAACGVRVVISPASTSVPIGGQVQFAATVTGTTDTAVTWSSPDAATPVAGLFQAPLTPGTYHVVATVSEHASRTATAVVTVTGDVDVTVTPEFPGLLALGDTVQFSAAVTGGATNGVTWAATGGTISTDGLFAAEIVGLGSVTATSVEDPDRSATVIFEVAGTITVSVTPEGVTIVPGATQQYSARVIGAADQTVTWHAYGGTIDATGLFTAGTRTGSRYFVWAESASKDTNGDFIFGLAYLSIWPPFEVVVDVRSGTVLQAFARARDWDSVDLGSGDCDGSGAIYQRSSGLGSSAFACAASNGYGETANVSTASSSVVAATGIDLSAAASFALRYTDEGHASGLHPESRLEGFAEAVVEVRFQVTAPIGYTLTVTGPAPQNSCPHGYMGVNVQLVYASNGFPLPATGTLYPGTTFVLAATAQARDGAQEDTCAGAATVDGSLAFSPPVD